MAKMGEEDIKSLGPIEQMVSTFLDEMIESLWCICPELACKDLLLHSSGGGTSFLWLDRKAELEAGDDLPIGGCFCTAQVGGREIRFEVDKLVVSTSS